MCQTCHRDQVEHPRNLALLMLTYILESGDHAFVKETYEMTM